MESLRAMEITIMRPEVGGQKSTQKGAQKSSVRRGIGGQKRWSQKGGQKILMDGLVERLVDRLVEIRKRSTLRGGFRQRRLPAVFFGGGIG